MSNIIHAAMELDLKSVNEEGEFEGLAAAFGNIDQGRDVLIKGAFANSLKARPAGKVKMLFQHRQDEPIGIWTSLAETSKGLVAKGKLILASARAKEVHALMKAGAMDGLSIGYRTLRDEYDRVKNVRKLLEVDLREVSIVTFPMNESAAVTAVKNADAARLVAAIRNATAALRA
ncbi:MAG: HK97 family phage prohead protease [Xanthobacteraceae bacterium]|nr:HK97 family phage prohead protease [Xanthobacteraceae bacterium]